MKYLIWHTPRVASNALCSMLSQTGVAGIADYINCGFPLGAQGEIERGDFLKKLHDYEDKQTTANGIFGCKLSWDGLINLVRQVESDYVYEWLDSIDIHIYLYRVDTISQAVSFYIAAKRKYFSTTALDNNVNIEPTPPYDYNEIAFRRMLIERDIMAMKTYFEDYRISPINISYESMTRSTSSFREVTQIILKNLGQDETLADEITPSIRKQNNPQKQHYRDRFLLEWDERD